MQGAGAIVIDSSNTISSQYHKFNYQLNTNSGIISNWQNQQNTPILPRESAKMSLPVLYTLTQCSDFTTTVRPYIPQLYDLPKQLIQSWNNPTQLQNIYLATNPLISAFAFSLALAPVFLLISEINKNYSQVDRVWSLLPTLYNAHYVVYAHMSGLPTARLDNLIAVSTVWSVRTF